MKSLRLLLPILLLSQIGLGQIGLAQDPLPRAMKDVARLSSSDLSGRGYSLDGLQKAAAFLETRFREIGVQPVAKEYFQTFDMAVTIFTSPPLLSINGKPLSLGVDFLPYAMSGSGSATSRDAVIDVHSGLFLPTRGVNQFAGVTRKGAVLIMDEDVPDALTRDTTIDRRLLAKDLRISISQQLEPAAVVVLVKRLSFGTPVDRLECPVFEVEKGRLDGPITSVEGDVSSSIGDRQSINVIGSLPGAGSSDSVIALCAHFDHLGGFSDSAYFPGANDNASGTAMLLALAEHFRAHPTKSTLLFIAVSGEEEGLLGSQHYVEHPLHDLGRTRFLLNFDVVGSGDGGVMVVGGENYPATFGVMSAIADSLKIVPLWKRPSVPNSDHYPFATKGIPSFYFYTLNGKQPYHRFDDVPATLDWNAFLNVFRLTVAFIEWADRN